MLVNISGAVIAFIFVFTVVLLFLEAGRLAPKKQLHNRIVENKESTENNETESKNVVEEKKAADIEKLEKNKKTKKKMVSESVSVKSGGTGVNLLITRKEIADYARSLGNEHIMVNEHRDIQIPVSLKWKKRTFAMLYAADDGILAVIAIDGKTAERIKKKHKDLHKPAFPKGAHWYGLTINNLTFETKQEVYDLLDLALGYVESLQK